MNDTQLLTIALSVIIPVSVMIYSNSRISDFGKRIDDTNKRLDDMKADLIEHMDNRFERFELLLKLHEAEHHTK